MIFHTSKKLICYSINCFGTVSCLWGGKIKFLHYATHKHTKWNLKLLTISTYKNFFKRPKKTKPSDKNISINISLFWERLSILIGFVFILKYKIFHTMLSKPESSIKITDRHNHIKFKMSIRQKISCTEVHDTWHLKIFKYMQIVLGYRIWLISLNQNGLIQY